MEKLFVLILNMSCQAGIAVCFVLLARWVFSLCRVPKKYTCFLWFIPFIRFSCPISFQSVFSLLPGNILFDGQLKKGGVGVLQQAPHIAAQSNISQNMAHLGDFSGLPLIDEFLAPTPEYSADPIQILSFFCGCIWIIGMAGVVLYSGISLMLLVRRLRVRVCLRDNIYLADAVDMPFVLGLIRPRIYLPSNMKEEEFAYVILHEQMHVKRRDAVVKAAAFMIAVVHWFNPFAWAAFLCMGNDIEMACDEAVMGKIGEEACSGYAQTLLKLSAGRKRLHMIPLAFGEGNIKQRVKNVMRYRKPMLVAGVFAIVASAALAVGLLTNPERAGEPVLPQETGNRQETKTADGEQEDAIQKGQTESQENKEQGIQKDPALQTTTEGEITHKPAETTEMLAVRTPQITEDMPLGADGAILDYADNGIIIFHGYFGLFVYSMGTGGIVPLDGKPNAAMMQASQGMIGAVDLQEIGCHETQGDNFCEVSISADADKVYLHPHSEDVMYVYDIYQKILTKQPFSLEGIALAAPRYVSREEIPYGLEDMCSPWGIAFGSGDEVYYGYLISNDGTVLSLEYLETDMIVPLFLTPVTNQPIPLN